VLVRNQAKTNHFLVNWIRDYWLSKLQTYLTYAKIIGLGTIWSKYYYFGPSTTTTYFGVSTTMEYLEFVRTVPVLCLKIRQKSKQLMGQHIFFGSCWLLFNCSKVLLYANLIRLWSNFFVLKHRLLTVFAHAIWSFIFCWTWLNLKLTCWGRCVHFRL